MAGMRRSKSIELRKTAAKEMRTILGDLKYSLNDLFGLVTRFEKCLSQFDLSVSDDEEHYISAEEEIYHSLKPEREKVGGFSGKKDFRPKPTVRKAYSVADREEKRKKFVRQKTVPTETIDDRMVNNVEKDTDVVVQEPNARRVSDIKKKFEDQIRRFSISGSCDENVHTNGPIEDKGKSRVRLHSEGELRDGDGKTSARQVKDIRKKFENRVSRSFDSTDGSVQDNADEVADENIDEKPKVNVHDLKMKFELEKKDLMSAADKLKMQEVAKPRLSLDEHRRMSQENEDKVKKVLKYFQPLQ